MSFKETYTFFNKTVACKTVQATATLKQERQLTQFIRPLALRYGWKYIRIETRDQIGLPDILLLRGETYYQIEAKMLRKKELNSIQDDLHWQPGQLAYMKRALTINLNYILTVAKADMISFITSPVNDYPDFIKALI